MGNGWNIMLSVRNNEKSLKEIISDVIDTCDTDEQLWFILTALRGCDDELNFNDSSKLKHFTSGRIRNIIGITNDRGAVVYGQLSLSEIYERNELLKQVPGHFSGHFVNALTTLFNLDYDVPEGELVFSNEIHSSNKRT